MDEIDSKTMIQAIMADKGAGTEPPTPDELLKFRQGTLAPEDLEDLLERAAVSPETARALLDTSRFPEMSLADEPPLSEERMAFQWQRFQERWRPAGEAPAPDPSTPDASTPDASTPDTSANDNTPAAHGRKSWPALHSVRFAQAAAAVLLVTTLGLTGALLRQPSGEEAGIRLNLPIVELVPESESGERNNAEHVELPAAADGLLVVLTLRDRRSYPVYEAEIQGPSGAVLWHSRRIQRAPEGFFTLELPRGFLPPGRSRILLWGIDGERRDALAVYPIAREG